jgi:F0F1-type ATP synthase membrane subunit c/vacuolar-type H+-ATPase subunit K
MKQPLFTMRVMQVAFITSVLLFMYVLHAAHPPVQSVPPALEWAIVICAAASALAGFIVQKALLCPPSQPLAAARNSTPLNGWFTGHIIRFATAESVALFGFVLRMMGSSSVMVTVLFGSSLLLLLLWQPGECPMENER